MPFKSEAQRRLFYAKNRDGEISDKVLEEWRRSTGDKKLPERVEKRAYDDPYYGQFGLERAPESTISEKLLPLLAVAGAGGLAHHGLMSSTGRLAQKYQRNIGRPIRGVANKARAAVGMTPVAQPPPGLVQDAARLWQKAAPYAAPAAAVAGGTAAGLMGLSKLHKGLFKSPSRVGEVYRNFGGNRVEQAHGAARAGAESLTARLMGRLPHPKQIAVHMTNGNPDKALAAFRAWQKQDPQSANQWAASKENRVHAAFIAEHAMKEARKNQKQP